MEQQMATNSSGGTWFTHLPATLQQLETDTISFRSLRSCAASLAEFRTLWSPATTSSHLVPGLPRGLLPLISALNTHLGLLLSLILSTFPNYFNLAFFSRRQTGGCSGIAFISSLITNLFYLMLNAFQQNHFKGIQSSFSIWCNCTPQIKEKKIISTLVV